MTFPFTTESVKSMDRTIADRIVNAGLSLDIYTKGYVNLGPNNSSAITRLAAIANIIVKNKLPLPPSAFVEYIVTQTTGSDKQDFRMAMEGKKPGDGKSYSSAFILEWYAILMAEKFGQDPKDFFSLNNCALLEDTEGVMQLLDETDKQQGVLIDDAGTAIGAKDHMTERNKNFNKVAMTCRTKRWFMVVNSPLVTNVDLQTRELMYVKARIYKPFHDLGFNILKKYIIDTRVSRNKKYYNERRLTFFKRKFDFWIAYSPDYFAIYDGFSSLYDDQRDKATDKLIHETAVMERGRKDIRTHREKNKQKLFDQWYPTIQMMLSEGKSYRKITEETGLSDHMARVLIAKGKQEVGKK